MTNYQGKTIWITGASSGLGEALALEFSKRGAILILSGRNKDSLEKLQNQIPNCKLVVFDISDPDILQDKVNEAVDAFGHIDLVIHNAGVAQNSVVAETPQTTEAKILQIDYLSPIQLTKLLLPHFEKRRQGHIVAVSGLLAYINLPGRSTYAAAKAGLNAYFGCLRNELRSSNIAVSVLIPGSLQTNLVNKALKEDGTVVSIQKEIKGYPLNKAANKIVKEISKKKSQIYVGSKKEFLIWKLWGLYPNFIIDKIK